MTVEDRSYGVIAVLIGEEDKFLCLQHIQGHWGFPKGHLEEGENKQECALRELEEETGIKNCRLLDLPSVSEEYTFVGPDQNDWHKIVEYFVGIVEDSAVTIQAIEISDYKWTTFEEALDTLTYDNNKEVLKRAKQYLHKLA